MLSSKKTKTHFVEQKKACGVAWHTHWPQQEYKIYLKRIL